MKKTFPLLVASYLVVFFFTKFISLHSKIHVKGVIDNVHLRHFQYKRTRYYTGKYLYPEVEFTYKNDTIRIAKEEWNADWLINSGDVVDVYFKTKEVEVSRYNDSLLKIGKMFFNDNSELVLADANVDDENSHERKYLDSVAEKANFKLREGTVTIIDEEGNPTGNSEIEKIEIIDKPSIFLGTFAGYWLPENEIIIHCVVLFSLWVFLRILFNQPKDFLEKEIPNFDEEVDDED
jgi:hypothetical protein